MKKIVLPLLQLLLLASSHNNVNAQNIFPATGRAGIYTTNPAASLQVRGGARIGTLTNYANIDSATGNLSFVGTSAYRVAGNKYAFQYSGNTNYGLFFNSTSSLYEFRNGSAVPVFSVNANNGNSVFSGTLKVGAYTFPVADGANGQVLKTNGAGVLTWSNDNGGSGSGWSLTGNAGTDPSVNFIGTTDNHPLRFRTNNVYSGEIDSAKGKVFLGYGTGKLTTGFGNTGFGSRALTVNTTGKENTAIGYASLFSNTTGNDNTAAGYAALFFNSTGINNTATGQQSLYFNAGGSNNTANGATSLYLNSTGNENTATGVRSLNLNISGNDNTATGFEALLNNTANYNTATGAYALSLNTSGTNNTANGYTALNVNSTGNYNTATGNLALHGNTTGSSNTATGYLSLLNNQTGNYNTATGVSALEKIEGSANSAFGYNALQTNANGEENTAVGYNAMRGVNTSGTGYFSWSTAVGSYALYNALAGNIGGGAYWNTAVGSYSLYTNGGGQRNTALGDYSLYTNTYGGDNTALGMYALNTSTTGYGNTAVGFNADVNDGNLGGATAVGAYAVATASDQVRIGASSVTSIGGYADWTKISDGRVKKNIKQNVPGLAFINKLKPITYNLDLDEADKIIQRPEIKDKNGKAIQALPDQAASRKAKDAVLYTGFVAQDVEKAAKSLNYDFSGVDAAKNDKDLYGLRYSEFVVPLVKAVQELSKMKDAKDAEIDTLQKQNNDLQKQFNDLKKLALSIQQRQESCSPCGAAANAATATQLYTTLSDGASLEQNIPNPFNNTTKINYSLPQKFNSARIVITDKSGKTIKAINISGSYKGSLNVDAATLSSGAYNYSLIVDDKLIATKQMVLAK